jgi:aminocarboxymuconate-semialdehyde decarboxylase
MQIIDSHFHWWPRSIFEKLCKRGSFPKARVNTHGGYDYMRRADSGQHLNSWAEWFDLDKQFEYLDRLGHQFSVILSIGPFSVAFSDMPVEEGRDYALMWNEAMADAQKKYPGRVWASAAVPLQDTRTAIETVDDAVNRLGLMGVNLPGSVGADARIDAERLEPFYAHVEKLGLPLFLHPTDVIFQDMLDGYDGALHLSLGRVIEVSVAAMRLILSGVMERHPELKIVMSHTGGSLPYQAGRMDKNSKAAKLRRPVQDYMLGSGGMPKAARRGHSDGCREAEAVLRQRPPHLPPQGPANDKNARAGVGVTYRTPEAIFVTAALFDKRRHDKERRRYCGGVN